MSLHSIFYRLTEIFVLSAITSREEEIGNCNNILLTRIRSKDESLISYNLLEDIAITHLFKVLNNKFFVKGRKEYWCPYCFSQYPSFLMVLVINNRFFFVLYYYYRDKVNEIITNSRKTECNNNFTLLNTNTFPCKLI